MQELCIRSELCEREVLQMLTEIRNKVESYNSDAENVMSTEQNAYVARNAEKYYRAMIKKRPRSWNIRDHHMVSTLERLMKFHGQKLKLLLGTHAYRRCRPQKWLRRNGKCGAIIKRTIFPWMCSFSWIRLLQRERNRRKEWAIRCAK